MGSGQNRARSGNSGEKREVQNGPSGVPYSHKDHFCSTWWEAGRKQQYSEHVLTPQLRTPAARAWRCQRAPVPLGRAGILPATSPGGPGSFSHLIKCKRARLADNQTRQCSEPHLPTPASSSPSRSIPGTSATRLRRPELHCGPALSSVCLRLHLPSTCHPSHLPPWVCHPCYTGTASWTPPGSSKTRSSRVLKQGQDMPPQSFPIGSGRKLKPLCFSEPFPAVATPALVLSPSHQLLWPAGCLPALPCP